MNFIDDNLNRIEEARIRNFVRWPVTGVYVWPNYFVGATYEDDVNYLKNWVDERLNWLDENMLGNCISVNAQLIQLNSPNIKVFPNPFSESVTFSFESAPVNAQIEIFNSSGMLLQNVEIGNQLNYHLNLGFLNPGIYFYKIQSFGENIGSGKLVKTN